jgi:DNA polymerase
VAASNLSDLLRYLGEIGYGEFYLPVAAPAARGPSRLAPAPGPVPDLDQLSTRAAACTRCRLAEKRTKVVFGSGDPHAELLFVGEGPGYEEDRQGLPFVGPAGELLTRIIEAIGLSRDRVYIANIVKCRPPGNRDPLPDEVEACREYLQGQIAAIRPRVIVALGRVAAQTLLGNELPVNRLRGAWYEYRGADLRVTYHPAALLREPSLTRPTWEDMQRVRERLQQAAQPSPPQTSA